MTSCPEGELMTRFFLQRFSVRSLFEAMFVVGVGLAGGRLVYVGDAKGWPNFNVREGYWGAHFLDTILYGIGNDDLALVIVSSLWFVYASTIAFGLATVSRYYFVCRKPSSKINGD